MDKTLNQLSLALKKNLILKASTHKLAKKYQAALIAEISQLGFSLDSKVMKVVSTFSQKEFEDFSNFLIPELKKMVGDHVRYTPLFKGFPTEVPDQDDYFLRRIAGFIDTYFEVSTEGENATRLSCGCLVNKKLFDLNLFGACPICQFQAEGLPENKIKRKAMRQEVVDLKVIGLMTKEGFQESIKELLSSPASLAPKHKEIVQEYFKIFKDEALVCVPAYFNFKETMAETCALIVKHTSEKDLVKNHVATATDVLRIAVALSSGDVCLKEDSKFKLTNSERRFVGELLNQVADPLEDLKRYYQKWLILAKHIHIGSMAKKFPVAAKNLDILRNNVNKVKTFSQKAHAITLKEKVVLTDINFLAGRPGEFVRRVDLLLQKTHDVSSVLEAFSGAVEKVPSAMLLKFRRFLLTRNKKAEFRAFTPKGQIAKLHFQEGDKRNPLSAEVVEQMRSMITKELKSRFKGKDLKQVVISPNLKNYVIPFSSRSASKALETVERGSQIPFGKDAKVVRFFIYWKDPEDSYGVDVDLSAVAYDEKWNHVTDLSFYNLQSLGAVHSGDIRSAPNGASEFIDIDVAKMKARGVRYVMMNIISYSGQTYNTFECFAGVMERKQAGSGEVYEPKTVKHKFDVAGEVNANTPLILDLVTGKMIWCDLSNASSGRSRYAAGMREQIKNMGRWVTSLQENQPNLYELFLLHAEANGAKIVPEAKEGEVYDAVFDESYAKNFAEISKKWL